MKHISKTTSIFQNCSAGFVAICVEFGGFFVSGEKVREEKFVKTENES